MNQEKVVNRILRDLKLFGLITLDEVGEHRTGEVKPFLNQLWTASWEESRKVMCGDSHARPVGQYDRNGQLLHSYNSIKEAARKTNFHPSNLQRALIRGTKTRQGWIWKYI
jgi:hypothetical protein